MPEPLKLLSLNCHGDLHWPLILPFLEKIQPDVVCFQELFEKDMEMVKEKLGMDGLYVPTLNVTKPNRYHMSLAGRWGLAIFTNLPFEDASYTYYKGSGDHIPELVDDQANSTNRALAVLHAEKDGLVYVVANTHFTHSMDGQTTEEQWRDFNKLLPLLDKLPEVILCGDFNAPRGREIFTRLSQKYQDNIPTDVTSTLDPELHEVGHKQFVVDGLFTSPVYKATEVQVLTGVSDHKAIVATIIKEEFSPE